MSGIQSARDQCIGVIGALGTVYHHARHILDSINPDRWAPKHQLLLNQRRRVFGATDSRYRPNSTQRDTTRHDTTNLRVYYAARSNQSHYSTSVNTCVGVVNMNCRRAYLCLKRITHKKYRLADSLLEWFGCRSLPWDVSCPAPDLWLTGDQFVDKLSAMGQPTRPTSLQSSRGRQISSNPCSYMDYGAGDH